MKDKFLKQAQHEYRPGQRYALMGLLAIVFLFLLPWLLIFLGSLLNRWLDWPLLLYKPFNQILGALLILAGWSLGIWSNYTQLTIGRGTPLPVMATQKLIVEPPYTYCRNPMALGAIIMYLGVAILFGSIGSALLVLLGALCLLTYIKLLEEKEMVLRFGQEYVEYRQRTPFLIPRFRSSKRSA